MSLTNDLDQHSLYLGRIATQLLKSNLYPSYDAAYKAVRLILLDAENIGSVSKMNAVNRAIARAIEDATTTPWQNTTSELTELAIYESDYYASLIGGYADVRLRTPPQKQVRSWMEKALMALESGRRDKVGTWPEFVKQNQSSFTTSIQNIVKKGYINGSTISDMVKEAKISVDGILRRDAEALVRTGVAFYSNQGREQTTQHNKHLLSERIYLATMDNRVTMLCAGRHLKRWPIDAADYPQIPAHFGCRSTYLVLVEGQKYPDGLKPAVGGVDTKKARETVEKRENRTGKKVKYRGRKDLDIFDIEKVKSSTKFDTWLKDQPDWFIEDVLGVTRAKLFKDGGLSLSSFTDMTGRTLTLQEMEERDSSAFKRAGIKI